MSQTTDDFLISTVLNFLKVFTEKEIHEWIVLNQMPRIDLITPKLPPALRNIMKATYAKYHTQFTLAKFDEGIVKFRPDLYNIFHTKEGARWKSIFFSKMQTWVKTL